MKWFMSGYNSLGKSLIRRINSNIFYSLIKSVTNGLIPKDVSDYRLVEEKLLKLFGNLKNLIGLQRIFHG